MNIDARSSGNLMKDKHTHYELDVFTDLYENGNRTGSGQITITIPGYVETEFKKRFGKNIRESPIRIKTDVYRNDQRVEECRDLFKPSSHLFTTVKTLEQIFLDLEER